MSPKAAAAVLVLVVVLFAAAVVVGANQDEGSRDASGGLADRLDGAVGDPSAVAREDIAAGCADEDDPDLLLIPGGLAGGCVLVVQNDDGLRTIRLLAVTDIDIEAPAPEGDLEVNDDVAAGKEVRVAVGEGETEVGLSCPGLATECQARLVVE